MLTTVQMNLNNRREASTEYSFYTIIPDGWQYDQVTDTKKYPFIVDTGTTLNYLPPSMYIPSGLKTSFSGLAFVFRVR